MICKICGAVVPEGQIACSCFISDMNREIEQRALEQFEQRNMPLLCTKGAGHLIPHPGFITLCKLKRYKTKPQGKEFFRRPPGWDRALSLDNRPAHLCSKCLRALVKVLDGARDERRSLPAQTQPPA